MNKNPKTN